MPAMHSGVERRMKRWQEQRWLLDAVVRIIGPEWDQGRLASIVRAGGSEATADTTAARNRIHKFDDISRELARVAARRERTADGYLEAGHLVSARESYFIAALLYGTAQWPIFADTEENQRLNGKKLECYTRYAQYAEHEVKRAEIPLNGKTIPGWLHLPRDRAVGRVPCIISIPGMDSFKEGRVAQYGDKLLERGIAVLAIDGPGQSEALLNGIYVDATNWLDTGREVVQWIGSQPDLDAQRIGVTGTSFGSFWATQVASVDDAIKGCAVQGVAHEPARYTLFHSEAPTFKLRFMFMSGYEDEDEFDEFVKSVTLDGVGEKVACPYLVIAGEDDSHSPIECTYQLLESIPAPKELLLYEGADHGIGGSSAAELGPNPANYLANWLKDRLDGVPMESRHIFVDLAGQTHVTSFDEAHKHSLVR